MQVSSIKKSKWFSYTGPRSAIIEALPKDVLFKKKDGFYVAEGEELVIKAIPEIESYFVLTNKCNNNGDGRGE